MLFSTYTPPPPPQKNNTLVVVLGVCGGCALLVVIGVVVFVAMAGTKLKKGFEMIGGMTKGVMQIQKTMPAFCEDLKAHSYSSAESLVDPDYKDKLNEAKIQQIVEQAESKLGKLQSYTVDASKQPTTNSEAGTDSKGDKMPMIEYVYSVPLTFEKGTATAKLHFKSNDMSKLSGLVTGLEIGSDDSGSTTPSRGKRKPKSDE